MKKLLYQISLFFYNPLIRAEYKNGTMYLTYKSGHTKEYQGSCTVWYDEIDRCGTSKEYFLSGLYNYCKHGKIYVK